MEVRLPNCRPVGRTRQWTKGRHAVFQGSVACGSRWKRTPPKPDPSKGPTLRRDGSRVAAPTRTACTWQATNLPPQRPSTRHSQLRVPAIVASEAHAAEVQHGAMTQPRWTKREGEALPRGLYFCTCTTQRLFFHTPSTEIVTDLDVVTEVLDRDPDTMPMLAETEKVEEVREPPDVTVTVHFG